MSQYGDVWSSNAQTIIFRYAEVLLTYVEAENELNGPSAEIYDMLDQIRTRVGMPEEEILQLCPNAAQMNNKIKEKIR